MTSPTEPPSQVYWQLQSVMKARGVASVAALRRKLIDHYPFISDVQLGRVVKQLPERMNMSLLVALCRALECTPHDLLYWGPSAPKVSASEASRKSAPKPSQETIERLRGPAFRVFSNSTDEKPS